MAYEWPTTNYHDFDLHELIGMWKKLTDEYAGLLADIAKLQTDLAAYQQYVNMSIQPAVENAVTAATQNIRSRVTVLENKVQMNLNNVTALIGEETAARKKADCALLQKLENYRQELCKWKQEYTSTLAALPAQWRVEIENAKLFLMGRDAHYYEKVLEITQDLQSQINDIPSDTKPVYNPIMQTVTTASQAINDVFTYACNWAGFTAGQWDNSTYITCAYWERLDVNALDFYTHGKFCCNYYYDYNHVYDPISGEYVTLQTAIYSLANAVKDGAITAAEYDEKNLTAHDYDSKQLKGYCYDWRGKELLNVQ